MKNFVDLFKKGVGENSFRKFVGGLGNSNVDKELFNGRSVQFSITGGYKKFYSTGCFKTTNSLFNKIVKGENTDEKRGGSDQDSSRFILLTMLFFGRLAVGLIALKIILELENYKNASFKVEEKLTKKDDYIKAIEEYDDWEAALKILEESNEPFIVEGGFIQHAILNGAPIEFLDQLKEFFELKYKDNPETLKEILVMNSSLYEVIINANNSLKDDFKSQERRCKILIWLMKNKVDMPSNYKPSFFLIGYRFDYIKLLLLTGLCKFGKFDNEMHRNVFLASLMSGFALNGNNLAAEYCRSFLPLEQRVRLGSNLGLENEEYWKMAILIEVYKKDSGTMLLLDEEKKDFVDSLKHLFNLDESKLK